MSATAKFVALGVIALATGTADYREAVVMDQMRQEFASVPPAPRCPKANVDYELLTSETAGRADGGEWILRCHYE